MVNDDLLSDIPVGTVITKEDGHWTVSGSGASAQGHNMWWALQQFVNEVQPFGPQKPYVPPEERRFLLDPHASPGVPPRWVTSRQPERSPELVALLAELSEDQARALKPKPLPRRHLMNDHPPAPKPPEATVRESLMGCGLLIGGLFGVLFAICLILMFVVRPIDDWYTDRQFAAEQAESAFEESWWIPKGYAKAAEQEAKQRVILVDY